MAISSTENAQCGVLTPARIIYLSIGSNHVALPTKYHAHSSIFRIVFWRQALHPRLAADPTGDWRVADGVANIRVAECNGSMWGAVAWEKTPGGRDKNNPDASKQSRPTLGMPILIDMKKKPGVDAVGRPSLQRQGRPDSTVRPSSRSVPTSSRFKAACWASSAAAKPGPASVRRFPRARPTAWPRARRRTPRARRPRPQHDRTPPRRRPPAPSTRLAKTPVRNRRPAQPADPVGDICLLPDIARFAH